MSHQPQYIVVIRLEKTNICAFLWIKSGLRRRTLYPTELRKQHVCDFFKHNNYSRFLWKNQVNYRWFIILSCRIAAFVSFNRFSDGKLRYLDESSESESGAESAGEVSSIAGVSFFTLFFLSQESAFSNLGNSGVYTKILSKILPKNVIIGALINVVTTVPKPIEW